MNPEGVATQWFPLGQATRRAWSPMMQPVGSDSQAQSRGWGVAGEGRVEHRQHTIFAVSSEHISLLPSLSFILKSSLADHGASCQTCSFCFERCHLLFARSRSFSYHLPWFRQPNPVFGYHRWSQLFISPILLSLPKLKSSAGRRNENT